ncbi:MAG: DUF3991 and TOPRIM domain-containing protein [Oscillospiraceae bacterium]
MAGVTKEQISAAKTMSAIEFLKRYRANSLVRCGHGEYELREHDSFKINESSSIWHWKSRDIGGKSALDYLVHVENANFVAAVEILCGEAPQYIPCEKTIEPKVFALPPSASNMDKVYAYLRERGICDAVIAYCASAQIVYESMPYHNCVFVGLNESNTPKYAALRGIYDNGKKPFKIEQGGSDKSCGFCIKPKVPTKCVALYESAIDAMAHMSLEKSCNKYRLSLGGIYAPKQGAAERSAKPPVALERFLKNHPEITQLELCFDNDYAGRYAADKIIQEYDDKMSVILNLPAAEGMDYGELAKQTQNAVQAMPQKLKNERTMIR